jgi:hypothetical protein
MLTGISQIMVVIAHWGTIHGRGALARRVWTSGSVRGNGVRSRGTKWPRWRLSSIDQDQHERHKHCDKLRHGDQAFGALDECSNGRRWIEYRK